MAVPRIVRARRATSVKSPKPIEAPKRNAANAPPARMSPSNPRAPWLRAAERQSAAPHRNSPKTRVSAGAPTQVFKIQPAIANSKAVAARAASAMSSAVPCRRTQSKTRGKQGKQQIGEPFRADRPGRNVPARALRHAPGLQQRELPKKIIPLPLLRIVQDIARGTCERHDGDQAGEHRDMDRIES